MAFVDVALKVAPQHTALTILTYHNSYYMVLELTLMMVLSVSGMVCNQLPELSYKTRLCASKVECQLADCNMMMIRLITSPDSMTR